MLRVVVCVVLFLCLSTSSSFSLFSLLAAFRGEGVGDGVCDGVVLLSVCDCMLLLLLL